MGVDPNQVFFSVIQKFYEQLLENIDEDIFRQQNLNLVLGRVNAVEYCTTMFNMPKPEELLTMF